MKLMKCSVIALMAVMSLSADTVAVTRISPPFTFSTSVTRVDPADASPIPEPHCDALIAISLFAGVAFLNNRLKSRS